MFTILLIILLPFLPLVVGISITALLSYREEYGWEVTPIRALGIPTLTVATVLLASLNLEDVRTVLEDGWPLVVVPAAHGGAIVVAAAYKQRRWTYVTVFSTGITFGAVLISLVWFPLEPPILLYITGIYAYFGLVIGLLTARSWKR